MVYKYIIKYKLIAGYWKKQIQDFRTYINIGLTKDVYIFERIITNVWKMPLHVVEKKIPYMDTHGNVVKPEEPNGYKFETLILDMIHLMDSCLPYEVERSYEFAPIKNKTGVDSVESARELCKQNGIEL